MLPKISRLFPVNLRQLVRPLRSRWVRASLLALLPIAGCARAEAHRSEVDSQVARVKLSEVHEEALPTLYRASGTVRGRTSAVLTSRTMGFVRSIEVRPGDSVRAGQTLLLLEANGTSASVRRARAGFDQAFESQAEAENSLRAARASRGVAESTAARVAELYRTEAVSRQEYDEAEARRESALAAERAAEARLRVSASRIDQAKAEVGEAQAQLDYAKITAPFSGRVVERRIDPGALATPGLPLLVLEEEEHVRVEAALDESRISDVQLGDEAEVEIESLGRPLLAKVIEIVPAVDVVSRAFLVKLELPTPTDALRPGMFARVGFRMGSRPRLVVPTSAISAKGALDRVLAVDGERLRLRIVTLGERREGWTEVLSGLSAGERIVHALAEPLADGARFEVVE